MLGVIVLLALFHTALPLPDPAAQSLSDRLLEPMERGRTGDMHLLGADQLGRDVLARLLAGARVSLGIAIGTVLISGVVGSAVGLLAGYRGGLFDQISMRLVDVQMAVPPMLLAIFLLYLIGTSLLNLVLLLAILSWWSYARVVRAETLRIRGQAYIEAALVAGCSQRRIVLRHILPQLTPVLVVVAVLDFATVILAEAGISYLGFGVQPPNTSWGRMVSEGQQFVTSGAWWLFIAPGAAIFIMVLLVRLASSWVQAMVGPSQHR
jgi:peptide/nickel transport system permease protein